MFSDSSLKNAMQVDIRTRKDRTDFLSGLVAKNVLTPDGKDWLTAALDPFHDYSHPVAGYPDADCSQTVVSCFQYQMDVAAPLGVAGNWDCHIFNLPTSDTGVFEILVENATHNALSDAAPTQRVNLGLLNIVSAPTGAPLVPTIPATPVQQVACLPAAGNTDLGRGISRVIAMGFEVHNTTATLHKQGSVLSYRMPNSATRSSYLATIDPGPISDAISATHCLQPPPSLADAQRLKGARTWEAADGVYANCFQSGVHNPLNLASADHIAFSNSFATGAGCAWLTPVGLGAAEIYPTVNRYIPYDTTGAMFTGLSNETTLTIKLRVYVERAPSWQDYSLAPLASPSAGYDVNALQLYAAAINMLPAAVKVNENAAGDWWRGVVNVLKHVAGPIGTVLSPFVPGAGLVGNAIQSIAGQINTAKPIAKQAAERAIQDKPRVTRTVKVIPQKKPLPKLKATRK